MPIEAIIFDMDDLMIYSYPLHMSALEKAFQYFERGIAFDVGPKKLSVEERSGFFGRRISDIIDYLSNKYHVDTASNQLLEAYESYILEELKSVKEMPGLSMLVGVLMEAGYRIALASSASKKKIDTVLHALGLSGVFEIIVSGEDDIKHGKPDPEIFLTAAAKLKLPPEQTLVLEDAKNGVEAAKRAGAYCIGVHNRFVVKSLGVRQDLSSADLEVEGLSEVKVEYIKNIT